MSDSKIFQEARKASGRDPIRLLRDGSIDISVIRHGLVTATPSLALQEFVSHYWLSFDNRDSIHPVLPDGAVDLVIETCGTSTRSWIYGTTTTRRHVPLELGAHYLGIRFKPGQSRHFIGTAAHELTDARESTQDLLLCRLNEATDRTISNDIFSQFDQILEDYIAKCQPTRAKVDDAVSLMMTTHGATRINEVVTLFGKSRRQFERVFLESVGISPKLFSKIIRFHYAAALMTKPYISLADIAMESGYSDQSHMSHEFRRIVNMSPAEYARGAC